MNRLLFLLFLFVFPAFLNAQEFLPASMTAEEWEMLKFNQFHTPAEKFGLTDPPPYPVRTMAEWEEIQALTVTWTGNGAVKQILSEIILHSREECEVIVICSNEATTKSALLAVYGLPDLDNVTFIEAPYNTIWIRDYGANTIYANEVDSLMLVDWIYNRPRPLDDVIPEVIADHFGLPIYSTTSAPTDLVNTGGNFTSDGLGQAFASNLVLEENEVGNIFGVTPKTKEEVDQILNDFMGIHTYINMPTLPYDGIHHIDMHMRLLDEETLMVGEYPEGVADGPQIEANLQYVLDNFNSTFGSPYKVVRVEMPPENGSYPDTWGDYRTYTNSVLVNKTVLVPVYEEAFDTTALRIYRENMPGYKVVGIDCNAIIGSSGALHCITRAVGVPDPLWIVHQQHAEVTEPIGDYEITAQIKHRSGIEEATLYYTTDTSQAYQPIEMSEGDPDMWTAYIPEQTEDTEIFYYISATATSGKTNVRPLPAPEGFFHFHVVGAPSSSEELAVSHTGMESIFPNPAAAITVVPVSSTQAVEGQIRILNVHGQEVEILFDGRLPAGDSRYYIQASTYVPGTYFVQLRTENGISTQKLIVK